MKPNAVAAPQRAEEGHRRIEWVRRHMPILRLIEAEFRNTQPFAGRRIVVCVHLEAQTANQARTLAAGGAQVAVTGSNPDSTKDDVVAALAERGLHVYAAHGAREAQMRSFILDALEVGPHAVVDDGGDVLELLHDQRPALLDELTGICEETTTGVARARERQAAGALNTAVLLINDARCKYLFDNVHGTGQSVWDSIMRSTNLSIAGKHVCVMGFGWCGRGIALRAAGLGARVTVCEVDPVKAADALMVGYGVAPPAEALPQADMVVTATGVDQTLGASLLPRLKPGAVLANAGHFWREIDVPALADAARQVSDLRDQVTGYQLAQGWVYLLGRGHIVNIASGDGHPAEIMDLSFALQALTVHHLLTGPTVAPGVHPVPETIDQRVAELLLQSRGVAIT
ncbi:MAG: adenosylhomocysteinase [Pseudomonadota bacterium]